MAMENYKELKTSEKLTKIQKMGFCEREKNTVEKYLYALSIDDKLTIELYESFGDTPILFLRNKCAYDQQQAFGFSEIKFNEFGWLEHPKFKEVEKFDFDENRLETNCITIGRGKNGRWVYGIRYWVDNGGGCSGMSIWDDTFDSRKESLIAALKKMIQHHQDNKKSNKVLEQVNQLLAQTICPQLELF